MSRLVAIAVLSPLIVTLALAESPAKDRDTSSVVQPERGSICVSTVPKPTFGRPSLANPAGGLPYNSFSVQVDSRPAVQTKKEESVLIDGLSRGDRHLIKIRSDGQLLESFWFTFEDRGSPHLCLWFKSIYRTWSLWPAKQARHLCACKSQPR